MWKMGWKGFRGWNMKMFFSVPKLNAGGAYWHNGLCIQIMEALCHIYGFAYCHLITVLPKIMKISWYGNSPDSAIFGTRGNNINEDFSMYCMYWMHL